MIEIRRVQQRLRIQRDSFISTRSLWPLGSGGGPEKFQNHPMFVAQNWNFNIMTRRGIFRELFCSGRVSEKFVTTFGPKTWEQKSICSYTMQKYLPKVVRDPKVSKHVIPFSVSVTRNWWNMRVSSRTAVVWAAKGKLEFCLRWIKLFPGNAGTLLASLKIIITSFHLCQVWL